MTPNRPYLLRALFEWICDNNCTPYLLVDATLEGVDVPLEHVAGGRIVLNASMNAVANFEITNDAVSFNTRFSGRQTWIHVPMAAVLAIYAKETQEGMTFSPVDYPDRKERSDLPLESVGSAGEQTDSGAANPVAERQPDDGKNTGVDTNAGAKKKASVEKPAGAGHLTVIK